MKKWALAGGTILTPHKKVKNSRIVINDSAIHDVTREKVNVETVDLEKSLIVPGLINAHDHLLGTYHPKVGSGPYINWLPWDNDLKSSPVYEERQQIENRDLYLLGAYRNLLSGVTTVSDHIPHFVGDPFYDMLPMKAIKKFALAHCVASFSLNWGEGITIEYQRALKEGIPFVTHIGEGFDEETKRDIQTIDSLGALGDHAVFVHCIAFTEEDLKLVKERGASCVWCADSNVYMYNKTADVKKFLDIGINLCVGTDSPMTGGENLLYEMRFGKAYYKKFYGEELADDQILKMVTVNPARAFRLYDSGQIQKGYTADLTVFNDRGDASASSVVRADLTDVRLVVIDGKPAYGDAEFRSLFESLGVKYQDIVLNGKEKVIIGDLKGLLKRISRSVGFKKTFPFAPIEFEVE